MAQNVPQKKRGTNQMPPRKQTARRGKGTSAKTPERATKGNEKKGEEGGGGEDSLVALDWTSDQDEEAKKLAKAKEANEGDEKEEEEEEEEENEEENGTVEEEEDTTAEPETKDKEDEEEPMEESASGEKTGTEAKTDVADKKEEKEKKEEKKEESTKDAKKEEKKEEAKKEEKKDVLEPEKSFLTCVVRGPVRISILEVNDLANRELRSLLLKATKSSLEFEENKGTVTMWFAPRRSYPALEILQGLSRLKLLSEEISVACPRAFAACLATEKRREKDPDFKGTKKDKAAYCTNIPPDTTEEVLKAIFPDCANVIIPKDDKGKNFGCAILEFKSGKAAQSCISANKDVEVGDHKVKLHQCFPIPEGLLKKLEKEQSLRARDRSRDESTEPSSRASDSGRFDRLKSLRGARTSYSSRIQRGRIGKVGMSRGSSVRGSSLRGGLSSGRGGMNYRGGMRRSRDMGDGPGGMEGPSTHMLMSQMQALTNMVMSSQQKIAEQQAMAQMKNQANMMAQDIRGREEMRDRGFEDQGYGRERRESMGDMAGGGGGGRGGGHRESMGGSRPSDREGMRNPRQMSGGGRQSAGTRKGDACYICGKEGHFARECPMEQKQGGGGGPGRGGGGHDAQSGDVCYKCQERGHFARECPNPPSQQRKSGGDMQQGGGGGDECYKCGGRGHFARECHVMQNLNKKAEYDNRGGSRTGSSFGDDRGMSRTGNPSQGRPARSRPERDTRYKDYSPPREFEAPVISDDVPFMTGIASQPARYDEDDDEMDRYYSNKRKGDHDDGFGRKRQSFGGNNKGMQSRDGRNQRSFGDSGAKGFGQRRDYGGRGSQSGFRGGRDGDSGRGSGFGGGSRNMGSNDGNRDRFGDGGRSGGFGGGKSGFGGESGGGGGFGGGSRGGGGGFSSGGGYGGSGGGGGGYGGMQGNERESPKGKSWTSAQSKWEQYMAENQSMSSSKGYSGGDNYGYDDYDM